MGKKTFTTEKNKLPKLWEQQQSNEDALEKRADAEAKYLRKISSTKKPITLTDSGWVAVTPITQPSRQTTTKNALLPESIAYNPEDLIIEIPDNFLPFVNLHTEYKAPPDVKITGAALYETSFFSGGYIEVYGDDTFIYKGPSGINTNHRTVYTQQDLDDGVINEDLTKKMFSSVVEYTDGFDSQKYKIEGMLHKTIMKFDIGIGCDSNETFTDYTIQFDPSLTDLRPQTKFIEVDDTEIHFVARKRVVDFTDPGSGCAQSITITEGVEDTKIWSTVQTYHLFTTAKKYLWDSGAWVLQGGIGNYSVDERSPENSVITSRSYTFIGYWLFYSTDYEWIFGVGDGGDADVLKDDLLDIPILSALPGRATVLPYSEISFKLNPDEHPLTTTSSDVASVASSLSNLSWIKLADLGKGIGRYQLKPLIRAIALAPANETVTDNFGVWDDVYTVSGTTYSKTTEEHTTKQKTKYNTATQDIQIRYKLVFDNPFVYFTQDHKNEI